MSKKAQNQIRKKIQESGTVDQIDQLQLDGIKIKKISLGIKRLFESCSNISYLSMNNCELQSLQNFPRLSNLVALELANNMLTGERLSKLSNCPNINFLNLSQNRISSMIYLHHLSKLPSLQMIFVQNNQICRESHYQSTIFGMFPNVRVVDGLDRNGGEYQQEDFQNMANGEVQRQDQWDEVEDQQEIQIEGRQQEQVGDKSKSQMKK